MSCNEEAELATEEPGNPNELDESCAAPNDDDDTSDQQQVNWRSNSSTLNVPSERIQFQITLEEGESGNED